MSEDGPRAPLGIVVAVARGGAIGKGGALPWRIREDLQHFKQVTTGHAILMGRKTWASIGRALPGRRSIVITRDRGLRLEGAETAASLAEAIARARETDPMPMVIGGGEIYAAALPLATRVWLTEVPVEVPGADAFFPALDPAEWREVERRRGEEVEYVVLERAR